MSYFECFESYYVPLGWFYIVVVQAFGYFSDQCCFLIFIFCFGSGLQCNLPFLWLFYTILYLICAFFIYLFWRVSLSVGFTFSLFCLFSLYISALCVYSASWCGCFSFWSHFCFTLLQNRGSVTKDAAYKRQHLGAFRLALCFFDIFPVFCSFLCGCCVDFPAIDYFSLFSCIFFFYCDIKQTILLHFNLGA